MQTEERILFEVDPLSSEVTTYVEIQYQGDPVDFAWLLPVPGPIDPGTAVRTAPAGLFDSLEEATSPVFYAQLGYGGGEACGCGPGGDSVASDSGTYSVAGVEVVGAAVVGPYAIEVLTAEDGDNLVTWLRRNGYDFPRTASEPIDHYLALGRQFLAVKLRPDVPAGPIDTLVVDCAAEEPTIPILLTAIASAPTLEITAYVLEHVRYVPQGWEALDFDYSTVAVDHGVPDYEDRLLEQVRAAGGRAWNTEYAGRIDDLGGSLPADVAEILDQGTYLTRLHTFVSPADMTSDPAFVADASAPDVRREHVLGASTSTSTTSTGASGALVLGLLAVGVQLRRRARRR